MAWVLREPSLAFDLAILLVASRHESRPVVSSKLLLGDENFLFVAISFASMHDGASIPSH